MTDTETAPTPSSRPSRGASGGGLGLLWAWLPAIIRALRRRTRETVAEMRKVLWPSRNEMVTYTVVVVIFVVIMVAIVALLDFGFAKAVLAVFG